MSAWDLPTFAAAAMPTLSLAAYLRITRASALYDLVVVGPLATPWTFVLLYTQLSALNQRLGAAPLPPFEALHFLLSSLLGTLVLLWSWLRFTGPSLRLGRYDACGRMVFALWLAWAMSVDVLPMLWLFLVPELVWGVLECLPVRPQGSGSSTARAAFTSAAPMRSSRGG